MTKLSWVWLGTEWATDSFFHHEVTPHEGEVECTTECDDNEENCERTCDTMNGEYLRQELAQTQPLEVHRRVRARCFRNLNRNP